MIPRRIHYCWFGGSEPSKLMEQCLKSWEKHLTGYVLTRWDETNCDFEKNEYLKQAYIAGKWAFVSDYIRLDVLNKYGGIYLDTDVELLRGLDDFLDDEAFIGFEDSEHLNTGLIGAQANNQWIKAMLDTYNERKFIDENGRIDQTTNVIMLSRASSELGLRRNGQEQELQCGLHVFPREFFCPLVYNSSESFFSSDTCAIHHFSGSWHSRKDKLKARLIRILGIKKY